MRGKSRGFLRGGVDKAVEEVDKIGQRNAGNSEESASASEKLSAQAVETKGGVAALVKLVEGKKESAPSKE